MKSELQLKEEIKEKIISILVKHGIKRILVFGLYARNEATPISDLDLIVDFPEGASLLDHVGIEMELSEALEIKIDLLSRNGISPYFKDHVLEEAIVIYE